MIDYNFNNKIVDGKEYIPLSICTRARAEETVAELKKTFPENKYVWVGEKLDGILYKVEELNDGKGTDRTS